MIKVMTFLRRHPDLTRAAFHDRWLNHHAPLVRATADFWAFVRGYQQNHSVQDMAIFGGAAESFDGCAELWFDTVEGLQQALATAGYRDVIRPDEETCFADLSQAIVIIATEHVVLPSSPASGSP